MTLLLDRAGEGDRAALDEVFRLIYDELQVLAHRQRSRWDGDPTMGTTALVHEAYLKLLGSSRVSVGDRGHFFALASRAMRQVLCNYARDRRAQKRGGGAQPLTLDEELSGARAAAGGITEGEADALLLALDEQLTRLAEEHPRPAQVVECRFFGSMSVEETAAALGISTRTVKRDWALAQAWLHRAITTPA